MLCKCKSLTARYKMSPISLKSPFSMYALKFHTSPPKHHLCHYNNHQTCRLHPFIFNVRENELNTNSQYSAVLSVCTDGYDQQN